LRTLVPFELFVAVRYLRDGRLQTLLILTGIGVGVGVIIFLSALITGLQDSLIDRTLGSQSLVSVRPPEEMPRVLGVDSSDALEVVETQRPPQRVRSIEEWPTVRAMIQRMPGVTAVAPTVQGPGIAVRGLGSVAVNIRGIEEASYNSIVNMEERLVAGALDLGGSRIVVGAGLARALGVSTGGRVRLQVAGDRGGVFTVAGVADYGSSELNERVVLVSLASAQSLFDLAGGVSSLEVRNSDVFNADVLAGRIAERTGTDTESWISRNEDLLAGLRSQSLSSVVIQVFVVIAVALGIASVLTVSVVQRAREIGILRATGTRASSVTWVFVLQGAILGLLGSAVGILLGATLVRAFQGAALDSSGAAGFPIQLSGWLLVRSAGVALGVGVLASLIPARSAARMDPAVVIRDG
jgi:lipoprotein-releasing system permease protein